MVCRKQFIVSVLAAGLLFSLSACESGSQKQGIGALLGGGAGALLGSQFGSGKGQLVGVALGALGGAFIGSEIGRRMDETDKAKASQMVSQTLENNRTGVSSMWRNPDTGNSGLVMPTRTSEYGGKPCREYEHQVTIKGETHRVLGMACREPDGTWKAAS